MKIGEYMFWDEKIVRVVKIHKSNGSAATVIDNIEALEVVGGIVAGDQVEVAILNAGPVSNSLVFPDKLLPPTILEVMWPENMKSDDIEVITPATPEQPGVARLKRAILGIPQRDASYSIPVLSPGIADGGDKIGFVTCETRLTPPPYDTTYRLV